MAMMPFSQEYIDADEDMKQVLPTMSIQAQTSICEIENFSHKIRQGLRTNVFVEGGYKWQLHLSLLRNDIYGRNHDYLSVFLIAKDSKEVRWSRVASFDVTVVAQFDPKLARTMSCRNCPLNEDTLHFGLSAFVPMGELCNPFAGFLVYDSLIIKTVVHVRKVADHLPNDSKKETGFVGLKNQGATCYLNSLIQTLYHLPVFRKAVYQMPTSINDSLSESIPLALQSLFHKMQYSDTSPRTEDLTKSFGWDPSRSLREEDAHELSLFLCEKLGAKMKGTSVDGTIQELFGGHVTNCIECIDVEYTSTRKESFYDIQLDVKGCKDIYESLDRYVEVEKLERDNQYSAENFGLQDARKGSKFNDFPPILQLHLKRFEYDVNQEVRIKVNDRFEFPLQLDLDRENGKYLSADADRSVCNLYTLQSVLVHSGSSVESGHYYAFIRPTLSDQWYKFDDALVTKEESKIVLEEHCGGDVHQSHSSAYMLLYIRESQKDKVVFTVEQEDIPEYLQVRFKAEEEAERKREEKEAPNDLEKQIGNGTRKTRRFGNRKLATFKSSRIMVKKRSPS